MARITVEDCLKEENNRFALVLLSSKRAKQLLSGAKPVIDNRTHNKCVVTALREIASGKVRFMTADEVAAEEIRLAEARAKAAEEREARNTNGGSPHVEGGMIAPMMPMAGQRASQPQEPTLDNVFNNVSDDSKDDAVGED